MPDEVGKEKMPITPEQPKEGLSETQKPLTAEQRDEIEVQEAARIAREEKIRRLVAERPIMGGQGPEEEEEVARRAAPTPERPELFFRGYGGRQIEKVELAKTVFEARLPFRRLLSGLEEKFEPFDIFVTKQLRGIFDDRGWELEDLPERTPQQTELLAELRRLKAELTARADFHQAFLFYSEAAPEMDNLAKLFFDPRYTFLDSKNVWQTIFSAPETKEGEKFFGKKIDEGMRWYVLLALSADPGKLRQEIAAKSWLKAMVSEEDIQWLIQTGNIFAKEPDEEKLVETRKYVRGKIDNDEAAERLVWNLIRVWGIATHFAPRVREDGKPTLEGFPTSDDLIKIFHSKLRRETQERAGHIHGPDATVKQTPERLAVNFLRFIRVPWSPEENSREVRSFWELWWNEGKELSQLPWGEIPRFAWREYMLRIFFAGQKSREGHKGLFEAITKERWPLEQIADLITIREINKALNVCIHPGLVCDGEFRWWFNKNPDKKWRDLKVEADRLKTNIANMIFEGAQKAANQSTIAKAARWGGIEKDSITKAREFAGGPARG